MGEAHYQKVGYALAALGLAAITGHAVDKAMDQWKYDQLRPQTVASDQYQPSKLEDMARGFVFPQDAHAESLVGTSQAYASTGVMKKVPGLDYEFDGGVYIAGSPGYPKGRVEFQHSLNIREKDIEKIFTDPILKDNLGSKVKPLYDKQQLLGVVYSDNNNSQCVFVFRVNGVLYHAFQSISPETYSALIINDN